MELFRNIRRAARALSRQPGFAATALLTLALAIGATTAIFSVMSAVVLRPLPFPESERLVQLYGSSALARTADAVNNVGEIRARSSSFEAVAGYEVSARYLHDSGGAERVMTVRVEPDFFSMLRVRPLLGRTVGRNDAPDVVVASEPFWTRRLGRDVSVIGRPIRLDDRTFTIVGVMPESFQFPYKAASLLSTAAPHTRTDLWMLFDVPIRTTTRLGHVSARLKPGVSLSVANAELRAISAALAAERPEANRDRFVYAVPLADSVVSPLIRRTLFFLFAGVALVLAIACANVTNLALVRLTRRSREVAVRTALGGAWVDVVTPFLIESALLAIAGGLLGLLTSSWMLGRILPLAQVWIPRAYEIGPDWRVFLFLVAVCGGAAIAAGLLPAVLTRANIQHLLRQSDSHSTMSTGSRRLRDTLVVAQIALAFVLAASAALLVHELVRLRRIDSGMSTANVITFHLGTRRSLTETGSFYDIVGRVAALPRVRAAGLTQLLPLQNWGWTSNSTDMAVRDRAPSTLPPFPIELRYVTPGYFDALGVPIRRGRGFRSSDVRGAPAVILINETLARKLFGNEDPIGLNTVRGVIVGIVGDVRQVHLDQLPVPEVYYPIAQNWSQVSELGMSLVVRVDDHPQSISDDVRRIVRDVDPAAAVFNVQTMDDVVADSLSDFRLYLWLVAALAALALLLVSIGVCGVISYVAGSRGRECAIRFALGASRWHVLALVIGPASVLVTIGVLSGLGLTLLAAPLVRALPLNISPPNAITLWTAALLIALVTGAACIAPARRLIALSPATMLRDE